jgi:hypothetical protein
MQDNINKQMASVASALPGTTQDFVMNARRMTDTLAQMMSKNTKEFEKLAQKLSGDTQASGTKAFEIINVEVAKATTLLEKLNPTRTTVPMTQIVEDMMKSQTVSIAGLRRYVSFRRATTFEAAMSRNLKDLNAAGAGTAQRLGAIIKTLKEAVPPELITAMTTSVSGVIEGFKSAIFDPDVGIFGLSRTLSLKIIKFNKETGEIMRDELGNAMTDTTNFFKMFADIFGNLGNLLNSTVLPGIMAIYNPFEEMGKSLEDLREYSFTIFKNQQSMTAYYSNLAEKYGMSAEAFKSGEKGGLGVILELLYNYKMISDKEFDSYVALMGKEGSDVQIEGYMKSIYDKVIPAFFNSPFISKIFESIGFALGKAVGILAEVLEAVAGVNTPSASAFTKAFTAAGGVEAIRRSLGSLITIIGKLVFKALSLYFTAIRESLIGAGQGNILDRVKNLVTLLLPTLFIPGVRNFVVAIFKGVFAGLTNRGVVQAAAGAAQSAAGAGGGGMGGAAVGGRGGANVPPWIRRTRAMGRLQRMRAGSLVRGAMAAPLATGAAGAIKGVARGVTRAIPGGALAAGAVDMGIALASGENFGKAAAGTIGTVVGGVVGSIINPGVGTVIGSVAGGAIGDWMYDSLQPPSAEQRKAAQLQMEAAIKQKQASVRVAAGVDVNAAGGGSFQFGAASEFTRRINELGLSTNAAVNSFSNLYRINESKETNAKRAADALNAEIDTLRKTGISSAEVANRVRGLQTTYNRARTEAQTSLTELNKQWAKIGKDSSTVILNSFRTMPLGQLDAALADRVRRAGLAGSRTPDKSQPSPGGRGAPPAPSPKGRAESMRESSSARAKGEQVSRAAQAAEESWRGSLGSAVASEMRHKPSGSHLVVANSSETVIPAAGGFGMEAFAGYLTATTKNTAASANLLVVIRDVLNRVFPVMDNIKTMTSTSLTKSDNMLKTMTSGAMKVKFMIGSGGKGGPGAVDAFNPIASSYGLDVTSAYRPGDPGYHGVNRARDYSNGSGPTPQMMDFAQYMVAAFGGDLAELIYTPLGFSIKNGQITPPYAQAGHYNHVHVAYAYGAGRPAFFGSVKDAQAWEGKMAPSYASISTVTANSSEGFGGSTTLNAPITIYQQPNQDPEELASLVAMRLSMVIDELRNH